MLTGVLVFVELQCPRDRDLTAVAGVVLRSKNQTPSPCGQPIRRIWVDGGDVVCAVGPHTNSTRDSPDGSEGVKLFVAVLSCWFGRGRIVDDFANPNLLPRFLANREGTRCLRGFAEGVVAVSGAVSE